MLDTTNTTNVNVQFPGAGKARLHLSVGGCRLRLRPGDGEAWVTGSYTDPTGQVPLRIAADGSGVRLTQGIEVKDPTALLAGVPSLDLVLSNRQAYQLTLETGASENTLDLGGLPITRLVIRFGAGTTEVDFSKPNPQTMEALEVAAGAGALDIHRLAQANAAEIRVEGGAATFRLDFAGALQRDTAVHLSTGLAAAELVIPATTAAKVTSESALGSVEVGNGWMKNEGAFWNRGALDGATPTITVHATVALGVLQLR